MGTRWNGIEERHIDGMRRMRETSVVLLGLTSIAMIAGAVTILLGSNPFLFLFAWLPLVSYLFMCSILAGGQPGYVVWRGHVMDRVWASFWLDDGNLEVEIEARLSRSLIPFRKQCRWSYLTHYLLPEGLDVGVLRLRNDRATVRVLLLIEGVSAINWSVARDVMEALDDVEIGQVTIHGRPVAAPLPWGYTTRV